MKKKRNKLVNFLKQGILLVGISLLLWNCETEKELIENNESSLLEKLQSNFNANNFKEALPYDFEVQWNNPLKQYSEELETSYYEFPLAYTSKLNPDEIHKNNSQKNKYSISYKLLITENEKQEHTYYILRFYQENSENTNSLEKNFVGTSNFTGFTHLLNNNGEIVFAKKFEKGIENSKKFYSKEFKGLRKIEENLHAKVDETCITITTYHYTDWYNIDDEGNVYYIKSTYHGSTTEEICETYWLPSLNISGGGGGGTYTNNGDGGAYKDSSTPSRHKIRDESLICDQGYIYDDLLKKCVPADQIITDNLNNPCVENILKELQKKDTKNAIVPDLTGVSHLSQIILDLFDTSTNYNLTFEIKQLGYTSAGERNAQTTNVTGGWKITLDTDLVKNGTQLFMAKTLIHESMHAFIKYILKTNKTSDLATDLNTLYQKFKSQNNSANLTHHEFMSQYVEALSHSLAAYDNHKQSDEYYNMLSWGGLETSTAYSSLANKTEIQNAINNERYGKSNAKGEKCD